MTVQAFHAVFGVLIAVTLLIGIFPYIRDILKGTTKPERASWLIWTVLFAIAFFTQLAEGARWSLIMPGLNFFVVFFIFMLAVKFGSGGLLRRDVISLIVAGLSLVVWALTKQPLAALLIIIAIDGSAAYLTLYKSYLEPETETLFLWIMSVLSGVFTVLTVNHLRFDLLVYPIFITLADSSVVLAILLGRRRQGNTQSLSRQEPPTLGVP